MDRDEVREFRPEQLAEAAAFIDGLPQDARRLYVHVREGTGWRFAFGDERRHVRRLLERLVGGRRFRIQCVDARVERAPHADLGVRARAYRRPSPSGSSEPTNEGRAPTGAANARGKAATEDLPTSD